MRFTRYVGLGILAAWSSPPMPVSPNLSSFLKRSIERKTWDQRRERKLLSSTPKVKDSQYEWNPRN